MTAAYDLPKLRQGFGVRRLYDLPCWMRPMTQDDYIEILFADLAFNGPTKRGWMKREYGVASADMLTVRQKSQVIDRLKALKEEGKQQEAWRRGDEEDDDIA